MPENMKNRIRLDYTDNPELEDVFLLKELGHTCKLEVEFVITEKNDSGVTGTIKSVYAPNYDKEMPEEYNPESGQVEKRTVKDSKTVKPTVDAPIMMVLGKDRYGA